MLIPHTSYLIPQDQNLNQTDQTEKGETDPQMGEIWQSTERKRTNMLSSHFQSECGRKVISLRTLLVGDTNSSLIADTMGPESFHVERTVEISMSSAYTEVQSETHIPAALSWANRSQYPRTPCVKTSCIAKRTVSASTLNLSARAPAARELPNISNRPEPSLECSFGYITHMGNSASMAMADPEIEPKKRCVWASLPFAAFCAWKPIWWITTR